MNARPLSPVLAACCGWLCGSAVLVAQGAPAVTDGAGSRVAVELVADKPAYFAGELISVVVRISVEEAFARDNLLAMFRQSLDVPVQLEDAAAFEQAGLVRVTTRDAANAAAATGPSFVAESRIVRAQRIAEATIDGRRCRVLELERSVRSDRPGPLVLSPVVVRFAFATRFRDDFLDGRVAEDRTDGIAQSAPLTLTIRALPTAGRPLEFSGAVGHFTVKAEASPLELSVGSSLRFTLHIAGDGDLTSFLAPRLDTLDGFHVFGSVEERGVSERTIDYDLAPLRADLSAVPAIAFTFFEPSPVAQYRTVTTTPIALSVRPSATAIALPVPRINEPRRPVPGVDDIFEAESIDLLSSDVSAREPSMFANIVAVIAPWFVALALLAWRRARLRARSDPLGVRARRAARVFRASISRTDRAPASVFAEYVASRLRCPTAAVIAPDVSTRLTAAGVDESLADRTSSLLDRLVAAHYGSPTDAAAPVELTSLVVELEHAFEQTEAAR